MAELKHRVVMANGIRIHLVEAGKGPLVLMVHGFPESWYSWRHQLQALANAGYRGAAIDLRGYGRSSAPAGIDEYRMTKHVADNLGVVEALGEKSATIVGHDWGAPIVANSALLRPDVFHAVALLSVPYSPRGARRPSEAFRVMGGKEEFYIEYFQQPGRAEAEIEPDIKGWLLGFYYSASGDAPAPAAGGTMVTIPHGGRMRDRLTIANLSAPASAADSIGIATWTATGKIWPRLRGSRSPCRRCSSAARRTGRHDGVARRSLTSARRCPGCVARTCSADAAIGCSRSGLGRSTSCWSNSCKGSEPVASQNLDCAAPAVRRNHSPRPSRYARPTRFAKEFRPDQDLRSER